MVDQRILEPEVCLLSSKHSQVRELRVQSGGRPLRIFSAFQPRRTAILLVGADRPETIAS
ncbi:hypothetical protein [Chroococcidiopsis sp.]|uniref:hypothetical protein n=1 Tax=Chroococcidiopsis sp. TaxID=3088168 RepID=UPI003F3B92EF